MTALATAAVVAALLGLTATGVRALLGAGAHRRAVVAATLAVSALVVPAAAALATPRGDAGDSAERPATRADLVAFYQRRVQAAPGDTAARLDLARAQIDAGDDRGAAQQYVAVLRSDAHNPEAHAQIGLLLLRGGRPTEALSEVERALAVKPDYAEARFYKGVILLTGLHRPVAAAESLRRYLAMAPFGAHRDQAAQLLRAAR